MTSLPEGTALVWSVDPGALADDARAGVLSPEERAREGRLLFERDRQAFRAAHVLVRTALSSVAAGVAPDEWSFRPAAGGRPEIDGPPRAPGLRFNLSHTREQVACVVTGTADCGVDVETLRPRQDLRGLAERLLAPSERADVAARRGSDRLARFTTYWTLKEAYAKSRGLGMALPFRELEFTLPAEPGGPAPRISVSAPGIEPRPRDWRFERWSPREGVVLAVAVRTGGRPLRVVRLAAPPAARGDQAYDFSSTTPEP